MNVMWMAKLDRLDSTLIENYVKCKGCGINKETTTDEEKNDKRTRIFGATKEWKRNTSRMEKGMRLKLIRIRSRWNTSVFHFNRLGPNTHYHIALPPLDPHMPFYFIMLNKNNFLCVGNSYDGFILVSFNHPDTQSQQHAALHLYEFSQSRCLSLIFWCEHVLYLYTIFRCVSSTLSRVVCFPFDSGSWQHQHAADSKQKKNLFTPKVEHTFSDDIWWKANAAVINEAGWLSQCIAHSVDTHELNWT